MSVDNMDVHHAVEDEILETKILERVVHEVAEGIAPEFEPYDADMDAFLFKESSSQL